MVDSRYGRGGTTARRLADVRWAAARSPSARRRGKLMLLDSEGGPTLGVRFGMTGGLVVDGDQALDRLLLRPGGLRRQVGPGPRDLRRRRAPPAPRSPPLRLAGADARRGPAGSRCALGDVGRAPRRPGERSGAGERCGAPQGPPDGSGAAGRRREPAGRRDPVAGRARPATTGPRSATAELRALHTALRATLRQLGRRGGSHMGELMEERRAGGRCPRDGAELRTGHRGRAHDLVVPAPPALAPATAQAQPSEIASSTLAAWPSARTW